jgi:hypothetical protein
MDTGYNVEIWHQQICLLESLCCIIYIFQTKISTSKLKLALNKTVIFNFEKTASWLIWIFSFQAWSCCLKYEINIVHTQIIDCESDIPQALPNVQVCTDMVIHVDWWDLNLISLRVKLTLKSPQIKIFHVVSCHWFPKGFLGDHTIDHEQSGIHIIIIQLFKNWVC